MEECNNTIGLKMPIVPPGVQSIDNDKESLEEQIQQRYTKDTEWRIKLLKWVRWVDSLWLICIMFIISLNHCYIHLNDSVLITLLATTTVNVLGLAFIILKGLFK